MFKMVPMKASDASDESTYLKEDMDMWQSSKKLETKGIDVPEEQVVGEESRMYTVDQIRELFYLNLNRSEVRSKIAKTENNIQRLQHETESLKE